MIRAEQTGPRASQASETVLDRPFAWALPMPAMPWIVWSGMLSEETARRTLASVEATETAFSAWQELFDIPRSLMLDSMRTQLRQYASVSKDVRRAGDGRSLAPAVAAARPIALASGAGKLDGEREPLEASPKPPPPPGHLHWLD